jgi:hypothetical protein
MYRTSKTKFEVYVLHPSLKLVARTLVETKILNRSTRQDLTTVHGTADRVEVLTYKKHTHYRQTVEKA